MVIEQELLRSIKTLGGLTQRRGLTENVFSRWTSSMPQYSVVSDCTEKFAGVLPVFSEQHKELSESRIERDNIDLKKLTDWVSDHSPFDANKSKLPALSSGLEATNNVNCHQSYETGCTIMEKHAGKTLVELKLKRSDGVIPVAHMNKTVEVGNTFLWSVIQPQYLCS